jgi:hypothetical protein
VGFDHVGADLRVVQVEPCTPFDVANGRGAEFRVIGKFGIVSSKAHQRRESEALVGRNGEIAMVVEHPFIATEALGVLRGATEHLDPPQRDVGAMPLADTSGEQRAQQGIVFHTVIERIDQPANAADPPAHSKSVEFCSSDITGIVMNRRPNRRAPSQADGGGVRRGTADR